MMRSYVFNGFWLLSFVPFVWSMDNQYAAAQSSIETILAYALHFKIKPHAISKKGFFSYKKSVVPNDVFPIQGKIKIPQKTMNSYTPLPAGTEFSLNPTNLYIWKTVSKDIPLCMAIYYDQKYASGDSSLRYPKLCNCAFSLVLTPHDHADHSYAAEICTDVLYVQHKLPFSLKGLDHDRFKDFTALTITQCERLHGTGGALNNILHVLKKLTYLDLTDTMLDEPEINAEHDALTVLKLERTNCTGVKRLRMPKLSYLSFDGSALSEIDRDVFVINCEINALGCPIKTIRGKDIPIIQCAEKLF